MQEDQAGLRDGEVLFASLDHAASGDARLRFIGRIRSDWRERSSCPKNVREARERGGGSPLVEVLPPFREGLADLGDGQWLILLTWLDRARRDLALQRPRHADRALGTFSLRSPVRPNPIGLHLVRALHIDAPAGRITLDAVDVLDATPLLDIKPFIGSVDVPPPGEA
ncbi:tRNA (N6-threonylcarbamoyladenosine(37)-N6)-methyltransferase TrmO [Aureimonas leprariae]|uniref:tRNA (N6-threonylcarbamoyladenosine(37)-N6)-methyltransferase TrmO n=1 Tax=Plantimonas leprariae TaxID=2615207 RepID=A0A7V7TX17_9HYPH|nr:tRNA (N6-threonylcarbamoyladenosine(37)-N6)-methyltransferase TrmO [Aureimonas leprariae]KAB0680806.1 tRNA (N6-threonylcarbamoyladenosine(37)-N6)-methyltransferase TrmO [Aureimonas leprariae]